MLPSKLFVKKTSHNYLYNIQAINNIPSIIRYGLLSHERARRIQHEDISMTEVQRRRQLVIVPNGVRLHQYANLYFDFWNPMLSSRRSQNESICILLVDKRVLDLEGVIVSDRNAATSWAAFYTPLEGLDLLDFDLIYARYWTDNDEYIQRNNKAVKCAEILVPGCIPYGYITGAIVINEYAKQKLLDVDFRPDIIVDSGAFF